MTIPNMCHHTFQMVQVALIPQSLQFLLRNWRWLDSRNHKATFLRLTNHPKYKLCGLLLAVVPQAYADGA